VVREHDFASFEDFAKHFEELNRKNSLISRFESAVDAIIGGDLAMIERLLRANPAMIRARSTRRHHATLLHYVGANGVEGFRQKTPKNAVKVAEILLKAGAEVDAVAEMYGGSTTLGLVATSIHPWLAGVQDALMEILLDHGAAIDQPGAAGNGHSTVNGCLANGRPEAAEFLAGRGASLDLEGAAGVGRLDLVQSFFNEDGRLKANATMAQMKSGFNWACESGRTSVDDFLLQKGLDVGERHHGETGLHWAAFGGHLDIVRLLLQRKAPVDIKDERFGGTPLGWALYGWQEDARCGPWPLPRSCRASGRRRGNGGGGVACQRESACRPQDAGRTRRRDTPLRILAVQTCFVPMRRHHGREVERFPSWEGLGPPSPGVGC
jgi:hypothetical protein